MKNENTNDFVWSTSDGTCYDCGKPFPTEGLLEQANAHQKKYKHVRRALVKCPEHWRCDTAIFRGDCDFPE